MLFIGEEYLLYFCRTVIGVVFAFSSFSKVRDLNGFSQSIARFKILPRKFSKITGTLFIGGEFVVVLFILIGGDFLIYGFLSAAFLLLAFSGAIASVLIRKISTSCSCFGSTEKPVTVHDLWRNAGFLACALAGWWGTTTAPRTNLQFMEIGLIGIVAVVFVVLWVNLGEIVQIFQSN